MTRMHLCIHSNVDSTCTQHVVLYTTGMDFISNTQILYSYILLSEHTLSTHTLYIQSYMIMDFYWYENGFPPPHCDRSFRIRPMIYCRSSCRLAIRISTFCMRCSIVFVVEGTSKSTNPAVLDVFGSDFFSRHWMQG